VILDYYAGKNLPWVLSVVEELKLSDRINVLECNRDRPPRNARAVLSYGCKCLGLSSWATIDKDGKVVPIPGLKPRAKTQRKNSWTEEKRTALIGLLDKHALGWRSRPVPRRESNNIAAMLPSVLPVDSFTNKDGGVYNFIMRLQREEGYKPKKWGTRSKITAKDVQEPSPIVTEQMPLDLSSPKLDPHENIKRALKKLNLTEDCDFVLWGMIQAATLVWVEVDKDALNDLKTIPQVTDCMMDLFARFRKPTALPLDELSQKLVEALLRSNWHDFTPEEILHAALQRLLKETVDEACERAASAEKKAAETNLEVERTRKEAEQLLRLMDWPCRS
jgi:hypothetical protein